MLPEKPVERTSTARQTRDDSFEVKGTVDMDWIEDVRDRTTRRPPLDPRTSSPVRRNSRGQPLEVVEPVCFLPSEQRRHQAYYDPLYHHPDFDDHDTGDSWVESLDQSASIRSDDSYDEDDDLSEASTVSSPPQQALATTDESECQLGGVLGMLARVFSSRTQQQTYSGDPSNLMERTMTCPIRQEIMTDPVIDSDGHSYEREAILQWLSRDTRSPITRKPLSRDELIPNRALKAVIHQYIQMGGSGGLQQQYEE